jgi:hypothetical protein
LRIDKSIAAPVAARGIVKIDLPLPGPPFPNMRVCKDEQLPKLNLDSTVYFQQCCYSRELPVADLKKIEKDLGMSGQITARQNLCRQDQLPHIEGPPQSATEQNQLWEKCVPVDDIQYTDDEGHVTVRNDTHRKCLAENCAFLSYCEKVREKEET